METQTILVEKKSLFLKYYALNLKVYVGTNVAVVTSFKDLVNLIDNSSNKINLIIANNKIDNREIGHKIHQHLVEHNIKIPLIIIGENKQLEGTVKQVPDPKDIKTILSSAAKALKITPEMMVSQNVPELYPINISCFEIMEESICDIFIKIPHRMDSGEAHEFAKLYSSGDEINLAFVKDYRAKGIKHFYIPGDERLKFTNFFSGKMLKVIMQREMAISQRLEITSILFDGVADEIRQLGMTTAGVDMAKTAISSMQKMVYGISGLDQLLIMFARNPTSYNYKHSVLVALLCYKILKHMEWGNDEQIDKMCFVSFFHDILLTEDKWAKIRNNHDVKKLDTSSENQELILEHALRTANLVAEYPKAPLGADTIILHHHGKVNGIGYTQGLSGRISPLAQVFAVAENYVDKLLELPLAEFNRGRIIEEFHWKYNKLTYKKAVLALEKFEGNLSDL